MPTKSIIILIISTALFLTGCATTDSNASNDKAPRPRNLQLDHCKQTLISTGDFNPVDCHGISEDDPRLDSSYLYLYHVCLDQLAGVDQVPFCERVTYSLVENGYYPDL